MVSSSSEFTIGTHESPLSWLGGQGTPHTPAPDYAEKFVPVTQKIGEGVERLTLVRCRIVPSHFASHLYCQWADALKNP